MKCFLYYPLGPSAQLTGIPISTGPCVSIGPLMSLMLLLKKCPNNLQRSGATSHREGSLDPAVPIVGSFLVLQSPVWAEPPACELTPHKGAPTAGGDRQFKSPSNVFSGDGHAPFLSWKGTWPQSGWKPCPGWVSTNRSFCCLWLTPAL